MERTKFEHVVESIEWSENALSEFNAVAKDFFSGNVTEIVTKRDRETGYTVQKIRLVKSLPRDLRRKVTESLVSARHAFDQATFAARNTLGNPGNNSIYFPWAQNPTDLYRLLEIRKIDQRLWDVFAAQEPYPTGDSYVGGDDLIRTLATIANNKHTVGLSLDASIQNVKFPNIHGRVVENLQILNPIWDSKRNEAELVKWKGNVEVIGDYETKFYILFKDSRFTKAPEVNFSMELFIGKAKKFLENIRNCCAQLGE